jgi:hypothetical protein
MIITGCPELLLLFSLLLSLSSRKIFFYFRKRGKLKRGSNYSCCWLYCLIPDTATQNTVNTQWTFWTINAGNSTLHDYDYSFGTSRHQSTNSLSSFFVSILKCLKQVETRQHTHTDVFVFKREEKKTVVWVIQTL